MKLSNMTKFWISFVLDIPMLIQMLLMPFHFMFPGHNEIALVTTTLIMGLAAFPYWRSAWQAFKKHAANMNTLIALGTSAAYFYSIFAMLTHRPVYFESAAFVTVFVLLGDAMEEKMNHNASQALSALLKLQAKSAQVSRAGHFITVPIAEVKPGDLIRVRPGEKVPVDGVIVSGSTDLDESLVTGESMPVHKQLKDHVIGATLNTTGTFIFKATQVGADTLLAQIVDFVKQAQASHAPIQNLTDQLSHIFVPIVIMIAIITFVVWYSILAAPLVESLLFAISVMVIACPCALGLATPTALMVGTAKSAKMGVLIKNGEALQKASQITTLIFDKTGTITKGEPVVTDIIGKPTALQIAASLEAASEPPLAQAIIRRAGSLQLSPVTDFKAVAGKGVTGQINGEAAAIGSTKLLTEDLPAELKQEADTLQQAAKTVLYVSLNQEIIGLIALQDTPKDNAKAVMVALAKRGFKTIMLTGDNLAVAAQIAKQVGISEVLAGVLPTDKSAKIADLQTKGEKVAFVGDGINDAPALSTADIGIAMGSGTDIAIESGDIVLMQDDLAGVVKALALAKKTFNRIKLNLFWALIYNTLGIPIAAGLFVGLGLVLSPELAGLAMAFSSISVLLSSLALNRIKPASLA
ncbi:MAG: copper-translocating P-type ATPase [Lactobacillus sp.]